MRIIVKNLPESTKKTELEEAFAKQSGVTDVYMLEDGRGRFRRVAFVGYRTDEEAAAAQKYFDGTMFKNHKISVEIAKEEAAKAIGNAESQERRILYARAIYVKNLAPNTDIGLLREEFEKMGKIVDLRLEERPNRACAIVKFREGAHAVAAFKKIRILAGMRVKICAYNESQQTKAREYYNTLFFNFDTVIKRTCEIERIDKRDLVNMRDAGLGARISLLETNLVEQTKVFLESNGIFLDAIGDEKNKKMLILRNADVLGALDLVKGDFRVSLAPSKCLALLDFVEEKEALEAYKSLSMRRYKNQIIYCEFAPVCQAPEKRGLGAAEGVPAVKSESAPTEKKGIAAAKGTNKIVVKNVPFQANIEELRSIFSAFAHVVDIRLPIKSDKTHRGFGFIILDSAESVDKAIEYFGTSTHLYGRRLVLEKAKA